MKFVYFPNDKVSKTAGQQNIIKNTFYGDKSKIHTDPEYPVHFSETKTLFLFSD